MLGGISNKMYMGGIDDMVPTLIWGGGGQVHQVYMYCACVAGRDAHLVCGYSMASKAIWYDYVTISSVSKVSNLAGEQLHTDTRHAASRHTHYNHINDIFSDIF